MSEALDITVRRRGGGWNAVLPGYRARIIAWCKKALEGEQGALCVVLANDAFVRDLNHRFRGFDKPTNVLSFEGSDGELGDIVLAFETVKAEAESQNKPFADHLAHLVIHGCLHLLGHDHEKASERRKMENRERRLLAVFGLPDPYFLAQQAGT